MKTLQISIFWLSDALYPLEFIRIVAPKVAGSIPVSVLHQRVEQVLDQPRCTLIQELKLRLELLHRLVSAESRRLGACSTGKLTATVPQPGWYRPVRGGQTKAWDLEECLQNSRVYGRMRTG
jgi:hypothetical protein